MGRSKSLAPREIVLNGPLAEQLGVKAGDTVLLRLPRPGAIPADSPLGNKRETIVSQRLTVSEVIPANGLGRFGLRPTQHLVHNALVPLDWLASQLGQPGGANAILLAGNEGNPSAAPADVAAIPSGLHPTPADYGLAIQDTPRGYVNITSDRMLLSASAEDAILKALQQGPKQDAFSVERTDVLGQYDCRRRPRNSLFHGDGHRFFATPPLGPFISTDGKTLPPLQADEIA